MALSFPSSLRLLSFASLLAAAVFAPCHGDGTAAGFSYSGLSRPERWGSLSPKHAACSSSRKQSPINIIRNDTVCKERLGALERDYVPEANATLVNNGINVGVVFEEAAGELNIDGKNFTLLGMHWHSPSEHRLDGEQFAAELHVVHAADDGTKAVIGVLYEYGDEDPFLHKMKDQFAELAEEVCEEHEEVRIPLGVLRTNDIERKARKYYRYVGSLTTPPCTENVIWTVLAKVRSISKKQVAALREPLGFAFKNNSRPLQALNGRKVHFYDESCDH